MKFRWNRYPCPCCGCFTLPEQGQYDICPVCFWEDDPVQSRDERLDGGANKVSLNEARKNYLAFGVCEKGMLPHVRKPVPEELMPDQAHHSKALKGLLDKHFGK
ncbi:MAG: CPCC family cysteine-rich protein [Clostridia bacterium]|nr:CPCC family cysteine-rich protein [Clostridia bacterium]